MKSETGEASSEIRISLPAFACCETQPKEPANAQMQPNDQLLQALIRAHGWMKQLAEGQHQSVESLGQAVGLHPKVIRNGIRLAFLEPGIARAILQGSACPT